MENESNYLKELSKSDFQIVNDEPDIMGWEVKSESGVYLGKVVELLFETQTNAVRYLVIDLTDNGMHLADKKVMIPIGIANLHANADEVTLPNIHIDQFNALPFYNLAEVTSATEVEIRNIIGSPAALRIEEAISEFDQNEFYSHHHFDKNKFYQRGRSNENLASQKISGTASMSDRTEEETTIHELIDRSVENDLHAADANTGNQTHHNEAQKIANWKDNEHNNNI